MKKDNYSDLINTAKQLGIPVDDLYPEYEMEAPASDVDAIVDWLTPMLQWFTQEEVLLFIKKILDQYTQTTTQE